jgi:hypothetical protein
MLNWASSLKIPKPPEGGFFLNDNAKMNTPGLQTDRNPTFGINFFI